MKDTLGDRIKGKFEDVFRISLPQRTYGIVRIDGKAFHTFTKSLEKPYCQPLVDSMDAAAMSLCKEMMGCRLAYGQSDEYSFLFTDLATDQTEMWFDGNIQKIASVSSSIFTAHFNNVWAAMAPKSEKLAMFDARVFVIPNRQDVMQYFLWRQLDASRNSLSMLASCHFSHKELHAKTAKDKHDMLHGKGINWNDMATSFKRGRVIRRIPNTRQVTFLHKKTKETITNTIEEMAWTVDNEIPVFNRDETYLERLLV